MIRFFTTLSFLFGSAFTQISPIRDPVLTIAPTVAPVFTFGPVEPIRTIGPIRTIAPIRTTTTATATTTTESALGISTVVTSTGETSEDSNSGVDLTLVYTLVPIGILALLLVIILLRKKREINNSNTVNIDLNIEEIKKKIPYDMPVQREYSNKSERFTNHIYEEVDYEARYEMPTIQTAEYENVAKENSYGTQVTTIV
tara:strand:+ start:241 stop:840 length:600 start_codon:yes stop_codon:yes gene_type:complete